MNFISCINQLNKVLNLRTKIKTQQNNRTFSENLEIVAGKVKIKTTLKYLFSIKRKSILNAFLRHTGKAQKLKNGAKKNYYAYYQQNKLLNTTRKYKNNQLYFWQKHVNIP